MKTILKLELKYEGEFAHLFATHYNEEGQIEQEVHITINVKGKKKEDILNLLNRFSF